MVQVVNTLDIFGNKALLTLSYKLPGHRCVDDSVNKCTYCNTN